MRTDGRAVDGQTDKTKLIVAFLKLPIVPKGEYFTHSYSNTMSLPSLSLKLSLLVLPEVWHPQCCPFPVTGKHDL
jgi:hypothetical protein